MSSTLPDLDRFRSASFEPMSFRERGATVPFTTPLLLNARIRRTAPGQGLEMVVVNPSGGRGALILPWAAMTDICGPTLFDRHLWQNLNDADDISPTGIRHAAQRLAAEGLAGRVAALAAKDAQRREVSSQQLAKSMLLESLMAAAETPAEAASRSAGKVPEAVEKRAERAVIRSAALAGQSPEAFSADLNALAVALSGAIPKIEGEDARLRQMLESLTRIADEITQWLANEPRDSSHIQAANFVQQTARQTIECAGYALAATETLITDLGLLVPNWRREKEAMLERARAADWVLDGWKTPMALWGAAQPNQRSTAIWEVALIAPILPREAKAWIKDAGNTQDTPRRTTQVVRDRADWRNGNAIELVARNENLISFSITYENRITPPKPPRKKIRLAQIDADMQPKNRWRLTKSAQSVDSANNKKKAVDPKPTTNKISKLAETRALGGMVETSSDQALAKIVALVDRLSNSEVHERILGPSLPRLKRLRPPRPASLTRLLFLPLSGALVDPLQWRRTVGRIPRNAIGPMVQSLKFVIGTSLDGLASALREGNLEDQDLIENVGRSLWRLAAEATPNMRHDEAWSSIGLSAADFDGIISLAGGLWRHAAPLWEGMRHISGDCPTEILNAALTGPAQEGRLVFTAAIDALLQRASRPSVLLSLVKDFPTQLVNIIEDALNDWVGVTLPVLPEEDFEAGARLALEISGVITALENHPRVPGRIDAKLLIAHRRSLDDFCRSTYREIVSVHINEALTQLQDDDSEAVEDIEAMARIARSLEEAGRRFSAPQSYLAVQEEFRTRIERLLNQQDNPLLSGQEIARIEEILLGRETAERLLHRFRRR